MKHQHNEPDALRGSTPGRSVRLHVNARIPRPREIRPDTGACFTQETFDQFAVALEWIPDTVHIRVILDDAQQLTLESTTGHTLVDQAWQRYEVKRLTFHATPQSTVQREENAGIHQISITKGEVRLYAESLEYITINVPLIKFTSLGDIVLGE